MASSPNTGTVLSFTSCASQIGHSKLTGSHRLALSGQATCDVDEDVYHSNVNWQSTASAELPVPPSATE